MANDFDISAGTLVLDLPLVRVNRDNGDGTTTPVLWVECRDGNVLIARGSDPTPIAGAAFPQSKAREIALAAAQIVADDDTDGSTIGRLDISGGGSLTQDTLTNPSGDARPVEDMTVFESVMRQIADAIGDGVE